MQIAILFATGIFASASPPAHAAPFTFDDVDYWVGSGANQAALVIDWVEQNSALPALVWGYRWDETASGYDMLRAVVEADDRLFAKFGEFSEGASLYGLGYDADNDGQFGVRKINGEGEVFDSLFDEAGIAESGIPDADLIRGAATDPGDYYAEAWRTGVWHYGRDMEIPVGSPLNPFEGGSWKESGAGMRQRMLKNGSWDSWAFELIPPTPPFNLDAFAENPVAATSPYPPGDFNRDTVVDALDYTLWKSKFGSTIDPAIDANGNGVVDAADYTIWRDNLNPVSGFAAAQGAGVPEPSTLVIALSCCVVFWQWFSRQKLNQHEG